MVEADLGEPDPGRVVCSLSHTSEVIMSSATTRTLSVLPQRELYTLREAAALG